MQMEIPIQKKLGKGMTSLSEAEGKLLWMGGSESTGRASVRGLGWQTKSQGLQWSIGTVSVCMQQKIEFGEKRKAEGDRRWVVI